MRGLDSVYYARRWFHLRLRERLIHPIYSRFYRDSDPDMTNSIFVAGTGRSGTTWVAKIIASQFPARVMFEPFHSKLVSDYARFNYFQYMRPEDMNDALYAYCQRIFSGKIRHPWIDRMVETMAPRYRIIKAIRANLFLKWVRQHFPFLPLLFVVRHPCAVVQSRIQLDWATDEDIEPFLTQHDLVEDHLLDKLDTIKIATTPEQKHSIVWCISNLIPLTQFAPGELTVVFYENLCIRPDEEIPRIFQAIRQEYCPSVFEFLDWPSSTVTSTSAVMHSGNKVARWQSQLSSQQIDEILSIVQTFGLDYLYGDSTLPLVHEHNAFRSAEVATSHQ